jgi:ribosome-associated protein
LDITGIASFTDYFVLVNGTSRRMLQSLANAVARDVKSKFHKTALPEGQPEGGWVLLDYGDVVVHLFSPEQRDYYRLEDLWSEGNVILRLI